MSSICQAEPIESQDEVERERSARKIRAKARHRLLMTGQHDHAKAHEALALVAFVLDIEIEDGE
jgi:hypothetical protein